MIEPLCLAAAQAEWGRRGRAPRDKLAKIFTGILYQFSTIRKYTERTLGLKTTSVIDSVIDCPLPNKILGCVTGA